MEQKYQIGNDYGSIMWDIELLLKDIEYFNVKIFNVEKLMNDNPSPINEEYAMTTDETIPLIVVQLNDNIDKLIDGNHRLYKIYKKGIKEVKCYYLSVKEHIKYICDYNDKVYANVVNNWK